MSAVIGMEVAMATVNVKFVADELTPGLVGGEYEIEDGSTVSDLLSHCEDRCGAKIPPNNYKLMYPIFNGKPLALDSAITKSGTLHMCRIVVGG